MLPPGLRQGKPRDQTPAPASWSCARIRARVPTRGTRLHDAGKAGSSQTSRLAVFQPVGRRADSDMDTWQGDPDPSARKLGSCNLGSRIRARVGRPGAFPGWTLPASSLPSLQHACAGACPYWCAPWNTLLGTAPMCMMRAEYQAYYAFGIRAYELREANYQHPKITLPARWILGLPVQKGHG
jgi:hypothetical protein